MSVGWDDRWDPDHGRLEWIGSAADVGRSVERFDMVVIGAGPAGEKGAAQAAYFGRRVAIVERHDAVGGTTWTQTALSSKTLREAALYLTSFRGRELYGLGLELARETVLERLRARAREVVELSVATSRANIERHGIQVVRGEARLLPGPTVLVRTADGERTLAAEIVLLATGSRPSHPAAIPFEDPDVHDPDTILSLPRIPDRCVVVGGGAVGCEYASIFGALGTEVVLADRGDRLLPFMDTEISELLSAVFERHGIRVRHGAGVVSVSRRGGALEVDMDDGEHVATDAVLFAAGRVGNTEGLGLHEAGVELDERGRIRVDATYRTTARGVYAAGDVIGPPALGSVSMEQGRVAVCHAFGIPFKETVDPLPPFGVYSVPEVGMVGMTSSAAAAAGIDHEVGRAWFAQNPRARTAGHMEGLVKLVFRRDDRRLLGVHVLGEHATELIHLGQAVLHFGGTIDHFIHTTFNVPTLTDAYKYAAYDGLQRSASGSRGEGR